MDDELTYDQLLSEGLESVTDPGPPQISGCTDNTAVPDDADSLEWARDVMWVRHNLKSTKREAQKWSGFRFMLWEYAKENPKEYVGQMLPRATQIIDRHNAKATANSDMVEREESRSIAELQKILRQAIQEAAA